MSHRFGKPATVEFPASDITQTLQHLITSALQHINTSIHQHINTSTTSKPQHIKTSKPQHMPTSPVRHRTVMFYTAQISFRDYKITVSKAIK
jgi:hypothetical protein